MSEPSEVDWYIAQLRTEAALRASETRFRILADHAPVLLWRADPDNRGIWFNKPWLDFTGRTIEQELGYGWADTIHPQDCEQAVKTCQAHLAQRKPFTMELRMRRHDGQYRSMLDHGVPLFDGPGGSFSGYIGSCIDITERRQLEERLREADRRKDEFLAVLAHELRNPLAPIRNAVHFLKLQGPPKPALQNARDIIERQVNHMTRLVDDLLEISRITSGRIRLQREAVNLAVALTDAIEAPRPLLDLAHHALNVSLPAEPVYVRGDLVRLSQIFGNLLSNAAKYTAPGGQITLALEHSGKEAHVRITDTGVGISPEMLERIFEMFVQVNASTGSSYGGIGIGLTLAQRLAQLHGGLLRRAVKVKGAVVSSSLTYHLSSMRRWDRTSRSIKYSLSAHRPGGMWRSSLPLSRLRPVQIASRLIDLHAFRVVTQSHVQPRYSE